MEDTLTAEKRAQLLDKMADDLFVKIEKMYPRLTYPEFTFGEYPIEALRLAEMSKAERHKIAEEMESKLQGKSVKLEIPNGVDETRSEYYGNVRYIHYYDVITDACIGRLDVVWVEK